MICDDNLIGKKATLRQLRLEDCTSRYVDWLNDPEVNQYLESRFRNWTKEDLIQFVENVAKSNDAILFAIESNSQHIGNIKIGPINPHHSSAEIGYFIGEKTFWGQGIMTDAISLVCDYGFMKLGLHRIEAGTYATAIGSQKALEKNGFIREGTRRESFFFKDQFIDSYRYGLLKSDFYKWEKLT